MKILLEIDTFKLVDDHNGERPPIWVSHGCAAYEKIYKEDWGEEPHCEYLDRKEVVVWGRCSYCEAWIPEPILTLLKLLESRYYEIESMYEETNYLWEDRESTK